MLPKVCICIPAYKAVNTIEKTLDSLVHQTYKNIVIYVVDNNSNDGTVEVANKYANEYSFIKVFEHSKTVPACENFDRCISYSEGDYLCIFHSDDVYKSTIIEEEVKFLMQNQDVGAVFAYGDIIDENDLVYSEYKPNANFLKKTIYNFQELFPMIIKNGNPFMTPTAMVKREIYKDEIIKHSRSKMFFGAFDVDVWLRILQKHQVGFIFKKLMLYRMSKNSYTYRSLLNYKGTIEEGMINVLDNYIKEKTILDRECLIKHDKHRIDIKLFNAFKAYTSGNFEDAKEMLSKITFSDVYIRHFIKLAVYKIVVNFQLSENIRKILIYRKFKVHL